METNRTGYLDENARRRVLILKPARAQSTGMEWQTRFSRGPSSRPANIASGHGSPHPHADVLKAKEWKHRQKYFGDQARVTFLRGGFM
jgi:hypothetical protein